ncbi:MAG: PEP-CTERM sorting domain-containing protein [Akkermansiaceae bacterium]
MTVLPATAATALIDFGTADTPTYNQVQFNSGLVGLNDTSAAPTGWSVIVTNNGSGGFGNAGAGANVASFPASLAGFEVSALRDSTFSNQGTGTNPAMLLTFSGLTAGGSYDLLLYGSRANAQSVGQQWNLVAGTGGAMVAHASELNSTVAVEWPGIVADGTGVISIQLNANASDNIGALALNFASITGAAVPEPSSSLLLGLAGLALVGRRKR